MKWQWLSLGAIVTCWLLLGGAAYAQIRVTEARIGCLDIQRDANLTGLVANACNGKSSCSYKAPTPQEYTRAGVHAASRTFCTQAMDIRYQCGNGPVQTAFVPGDAWGHAPADLICQSAPPAPGSVREPITITSARIGCLDIQREGNLTAIVANFCNGRASCSYKAPTPQQYAQQGVRAATRPLCTQAMEITYRCGQNDPQAVTVAGDAWGRPPAEIVCDGRTIAANREYVTPPREACDSARLGPPDYFIAPRDMLDWTPTQSHEDYISGFRPPQAATPAVYNSRPGTITGAPGSTLGANEGRLRAELRTAAAAAKKDPLAVLCEAAQRFTRNAPASAGTPSDHDFGNAFADLSVTGKETFDKFAQLRPTEANLRSAAACSGASDGAIRSALDRAYLSANALRGPHSSPARQSLGWMAVSGEDDQPYRPVNMPTNKGKFPEFQITVSRVPGFAVPPIHTRYMIAHARNAPVFQRSAAPLIDGGSRQVQADPLPALANDAEVILFIHGMDSRLEEADDLTGALHKLGGHNWTVISFDLPTSGYARNIDHRSISPIAAVTCHNTPLVDFIEEFIVAFVDTLDGQLHGQLKPRIKAVVGGSLGGNMSMRLGRRPNTPWIPAVVPWSPAAIWPSMIARAPAAGCDTSYNPLHDAAVTQPLKWAGLDGRFLPDHETPELRRELFYGGFDWSPVGGLGGPPQAQCWFSNEWGCKLPAILAARLDRQETYDAKFRAWHWRLGAEQLAFSQQQFAPNSQQPLYLFNTKRMLLLGGIQDTCGDLCKYTIDVASKMQNTPGYARFLRSTGHSLDNEHPDWVARQIADFLTHGSS